MKYKEFDQLLGKHISVANEFCNCTFENNNLEGEIYVSQYFNREYHGISFSFITIVINEKDIIQSVTIHFQEIINRQFYDSFIQDYGTPDNILIIDNKQIISETISKDEKEAITQNLKKSNLELREGTFEENPLYIIWKKEGYKISAFLRQQNMSEITFTSIARTSCKN